MFKKQMKKMTLLDWVLAKLGIVSFVVFLIGVWPFARNLVFGINPWYFLIISIITVAIVQIRIWKK